VKQTPTHAFPKPILSAIGATFYKIRRLDRSS